MKNSYYEGNISLNLENQVKTIKKSGYWFETVSENNGF